MLPLSLGLSLAVISLVGFLVNAYIVLVVVLTKQITANNILLLHLGIVNALLCAAFLVFTVPNIARSDGTSAFGAAGLCTFHGVLVTAMHPVALWTLCCLNCDRCCAIAAPLHYGDFVNTRRVMICLAAGWTFALLLSLPPIMHIAPYRYNADFGACVPHFGAESSTIPLSNNYTTPADAAAAANSTLGGAVLWYAIVYTLSTLLLPAALIIGCNIKVLMIARYHNHRIASAIYEVTLSAQVTITHQRNPFDADGQLLPAGPPLKPLRPPRSRRSPVISVLQLIGTFVLMYAPYYASILWSSIAAALDQWGQRPQHHDFRHGLGITAAALLACSPFVNGILYGVKNKIMRKTFQNYWRKQKTKSEMCQEIQARTPSTCGSRRPSLSTLSILQQRPPLSQRRMSETGYDHHHHHFHLHLRHHHQHPSMQHASSASQNHRYQSSDPERPLMKRIASEISWRPTSLTFADMTDTSPTTLLSPVAVAAAATGGLPADAIELTGSGILVHSASSNTLQLPALNSPTVANGGAVVEDNSVVTNGSGVVWMHSNGTTEKTPNGRSALGMLQKMLRIEIRDEGQQLHDESKPLRSPRILITQPTCVEDSDRTDSLESVNIIHQPENHPDEAGTRIAVVDDDVERCQNGETVAMAAVGSFSWPMARRKKHNELAHEFQLSDDDDVIVMPDGKGIDIDDNDDEDDEEAEDYSRLLVAATSSLSASNSTTMSTVSMRPMPTTSMSPSKTVEQTAPQQQQQSWTTSARDVKALNGAASAGVCLDVKAGHCVIQFKEHLFTSQKDIVL